MPPISTVSVPFQPSPAGQLPPTGNHPLPGSHPLPAVPASSMHPLGILPQQAGSAPPHAFMGATAGGPGSSQPHPTLRPTHPSSMMDGTDVSGLQAARALRPPSPHLFMGATAGLGSSQPAPILQPTHPSSLMDGLDATGLQAGRALRAPSPHAPLSGQQAAGVQAASPFLGMSGMHGQSGRPASPHLPSSGLHPLQPASTHHHHQQQQQRQWTQGLHPVHATTAAPPTHPSHPDAHPHPEQLQQQQQQASPAAPTREDNHSWPAHSSQRANSPSHMPAAAGYQPRFPSPNPTSQPDGSFHSGQPTGQQQAGVASETTHDHTRQPPRGTTQPVPDISATPDRWMEMWAQQLPTMGDLSAAGLAAAGPKRPPHATGWLSLLLSIARHGSLRVEMAGAFLSSLLSMPGHGSLRVEMAGAVRSIRFASVQTSGCLHVVFH